MSFSQKQIFELEKTAALIKSGAVKNIIGLIGAGCSVAASIPDFRSKGGLYDTLRPELITATDEQRQMMKDDPTQVVYRSMFEQNQFPYLEVRRPFIIGTAEGKWKPTIAQAFFAILFQKNLLHRLYSQNIDGLDYQVEIPRSKICSVHGTMTRVSCEFCGAPGPNDGSLKTFAELVKKNIRNIYDKDDKEAPSESTNILCEKCNKAGLKPSTVCYGSSMPDDWLEAVIGDFPSIKKGTIISEEEHMKQPDLMIVAGTSLTVFPAASLPEKMRERGKPVVVANRDPVDCSSFTFLQGDLDATFLKLTDLCGWLKELEEIAFEKKLLCEASCETIRRYKSSKPLTKEQIDNL